MQRAQRPKHTNTPDATFKLDQICQRRRDGRNGFADTSAVLESMALAAWRPWGPNIDKDIQVRLLGPESIATPALVRQLLY